MHRKEVSLEKGAADGLTVQKTERTAEKEASVILFGNHFTHILGHRFPLSSIKTGGRNVVYPYDLDKAKAPETAWIRGF